jgi:signal peptidase I
MSFSFNDPQNTNPSSESDSTGPDSLDSTEPIHDEDSYASASGKTPLPPFGQDRIEEESALKPLADTLPELEAILRNEKLAPPPEPPPPKHIYQISSAESNWVDYNPPYLEGPPSEQEETAPSGWKTAWAVVREVGETIILTLIIFFLIQIVIRNFRVVGTSMVDNLHDGQYLIIDKISYSPLLRETLGWTSPRHGDVVVFEPPNRPTEDYVKRIVGLPGEAIEIRNGQVLVNGQPLAEPFHPQPGSYSMPPRLVPEGHVFVLGDNRNNSNDSHNWGPLPIENIVGRAWLSYWPPDQWGVIPHDAPTEEATLKHLLDELVPNANAESE